MSFGQSHPGLTPKSSLLTRVNSMFPSVTVKLDDSLFFTVRALKARTESDSSLPPQHLAEKPAHNRHLANGHQVDAWGSEWISEHCWSSYWTLSHLSQFQNTRLYHPNEIQSLPTLLFRCMTKYLCFQSIFAIIVFLNDSLKLTPHYSKAAVIETQPTETHLFRQPFPTWRKIGI